MRVVPADDLHAAIGDGLPHLHLGERVELDVHRARVGRDRAAWEGLAQVQLPAGRVPMAAEEADDLTGEQVRVEVDHGEHERVDGHPKRLRAGHAAAVAAAVPSNGREVDVALPIDSAGSLVYQALCSLLKPSEAF